MKGWTESTLGDVVTLQRGFDLPERMRETGVVPIVSSSGVSGYHSSFKVKGPGVVTGRYGTLGEVFYITQDFWPLNTTLWVKDFKGNHPRFISYLLQTLNFARQNAAGAVPGVNRNALHLLPVRTPPLRIQGRIASILSTYDDLIENNTRRIKILEEMAQMLYREWFVNFCFPGHEKVRMVESELGPIPEAWAVEPLERLLATVETGNRPKGGVSEITHGVPSLGAESILGVGRFDYLKTKYVPVEYFYSMNQGRLRDRDVLVYKDGGQPGNFHPHVSLVGEGFPFSVMSINSHVYRLRGTNRVTQDFLYYHLSSEAMLDWMRKHGTGSAIPGLARKDLLRLPVILPPAELLTRFDEFARPLTSSILNNAKRSANLRTTRDLLLPKLISGEISVVAADEAAAELAEQTA